MEVIGIQKESSFFRLAYLSKVNGKVVIRRLEKEVKAPNLRKDLLSVTGIEGEDLLIRRLETPLRNIKALYKTLPFQLEALIPYSLDDVVVKPVYTKKEKKTEALFFTASKKALNSHIAHFQREGIDPEWISAVPMALFRFASFVAPDEKNLVVFHIGMEKIQIVSMQDETILSHITLRIGAQDLSEGDSATVVSELKREVDRTFCFLAHKEKENRTRKVLFCGERTKEVEALLRDEKSLMTPMSIRGQHGFGGEAICPYAISIGLAIDALKNDSSSIQFRQEAFISKKLCSSIKRGGVYGGILSGALLILAFIGSYLYCQKKENALINQVKGLVAYYEKEIPTLSGGGKKGTLIDILSELNLRLRFPKNEGGIFSTPPLVTDLLSFISSHPNFEGINIRRIEYELKSYPSIQRSKDKYRPKVCVTFTSVEAGKARELHDAIINDEIIVNRNQEIEWKQNQDEYEITFFLQA